MRRWKKNNITNALAKDWTEVSEVQCSVQLKTIGISKCYAPDSNRGAWGPWRAWINQLEFQKYYALDSNRGRVGYRCAKAKRRRFEAQTLAFNRRWRTAETAVFSGQPGGAPPSNFPEISKPYIIRKISPRGSWIHKHLSLIPNTFHESNKRNFMHQTLNPYISLNSQPKLKLFISAFSPQRDLQDHIHELEK